MTLTFKSLHDLAPQYLTELVIPYRPKRSLRSAKKDLLNLPKMSLKRYGYKSFQYPAPWLWNNLQESIKSCKELSSFESSLKTYLFLNYYNILFINIQSGVMYFQYAAPALWI